MNDLEPIDRDSLLSEISGLLPQPVQQETGLDGFAVLVGGNPGEVVIRIGGGRVRIAVYSVRWEGHEPVVRPRRLGSLNWKSLPALRTMMVLRDLIDSAQEIRRSVYKKCERCNEVKPPEWLHDETTCQTCAELYLGVTY